MNPSLNASYIKLAAKHEINAKDFFVVFLVLKFLDIFGISIKHYGNWIESTKILIEINIKHHIDFNGNHHETKKTDETGKYLQCDAKLEFKLQIKSISN